MAFSAEDFKYFVKSVYARLKKGGASYKDRSFSADPKDLAYEILQELEDVCGWAFILHVRIMDVLGGMGAARLGEPSEGGEVPEVVRPLPDENAGQPGPSDEQPNQQRTAEDFARLQEVMAETAKVASTLSNSPTLRSANLNDAENELEGDKASIRGRVMDNVNRWQRHWDRNPPPPTRRERKMPEPIRYFDCVGCGKHFEVSHLHSWLGDVSDICADCGDTKMEKRNVGP